MISPAHQPLQRWLMIITALLVLTAASDVSDANASDVPFPAPPLVMELFTSQGCPACPPADKVVHELLQNRPDNLILFSCHVDYWDNRGWKDPFSSEWCTYRQSGYAYSMNRPQLATPQMITNGRIVTVASRADEVEEALESEAERSAPYLPVKLHMNKEKQMVMEISESIGGAIEGEADIWLVSYDTQATTTLPRARNGVSEFTSYHNVLSLSHAGTWQGKPISGAMKDLPQGDYAAVLIQRPDMGEILGAASVRLK